MWESYTGFLRQITLQFPRLALLVISQRTECHCTHPAPMVTFE
jgi:hypothetical protein